MVARQLWLGSVGPYLFDRDAFVPSSNGLLTVYQAPMVFEDELGNFITIDEELNDLALNLADKEDIANKVTSISISSTDVQYPSAKLLYDKLALKEDSLPTTPADPTEKFLDGNKSWQAFPVFTIPSAYLEMVTPVGTTSTSLEDVSGGSTTITILGTSHINVNCSFELQTQSGASASVIGIALNINGTDHDEMQRYLSGTNDLGLGSITHRTSSPLSPGTYTIKLRFRRVTGMATPGINKAHLSIIGLEASLL